MEERLKVEVQISSYDAKGLQCFVAEVSAGGVRS